jgi:hypothetical protein
MQYRQHRRSNYKQFDIEMCKGQYLKEEWIQSLFEQGEVCPESRMSPPTTKKKMWVDIDTPTWYICIGGECCEEKSKAFKARFFFGAGKKFADCRFVLHRF